MAPSLANLGNVAREQGEYKQAAALLDESLALERELGDKAGIARQLANQADLARDTGDFGQAAALYWEALVTYLDLGDIGDAFFSLEGLAAVDKAQGRLLRAARLLGAVEALRERNDAPLSPTGQVRIDQHIVDLRAALDAAAFADAWAQGRALSLEEAVREAMHEEVPDGPATPEPRDARRGEEYRPHTFGRAQRTHVIRQRLLSIGPSRHAIDHSLFACTSYAGLPVAIAAQDRTSASSRAGMRAVRTR